MSTLTATTATVPTREEVSPANQAIFDQLQKSVGFVPNLYAYYAHSDTALADYLALQNRKSTLRGKEREIINLVTSQVNNCRYCLSAHTALGKLQGFSEEQILEIRRAEVTFNPQFAALATFVKSTVENRGRASEEAKEALLAAGYTEAKLVDIVLVIGDKTISNYIHNLTDLEIDFPLADAI